MTGKIILTGGHRGLGCTDHDFYQKHRDIATLPVENTLESFAAGFAQGMDYFETDYERSADRVAFTLHNVKPEDHFFGTEKPPMLLNKMNFADIQKYPVGRHGTGKVAKFSDTLELSAKMDPKTLPWVICIEIKGVQGSGQPYEEDDDFIDLLAEMVETSPVSKKRVLYSSFSLQNMIRMSHKSPQSHYGMLFAEKGEVKGIYADHRDDPRYQYLQFDLNSVDMVQKIWAEEAHPEAVLGYVHPEILTIDEAMIGGMKTRGLGINCWALFEEFDQTRADYYKKTIAHASEKGVAFTAITDYLPEMHRL